METYKNYSLKELNSFNLNVRAKIFSIIRSIRDVRELLTMDCFQDNRHLILGEGNNILFTKNFDGLIIRPGIMDFKVIKETAGYVTIKAGAGNNWNAFVAICMVRQYWGLENLSLIPGSVGSAPIQNIGAYGVEVKDTIEQVEGIDISTGELLRLSNNECEFGYRSSIFKTSLKDKIMVTSFFFKLRKYPNTKLEYGPLKERFKDNPSPGIISISTFIIETRMSKLPNPDKLGNAGSFFKNPVIPLEEFRGQEDLHPGMPHYPAGDGLEKIPAGWLIEQCGWKGKRLGNVGVYTEHALVIVNYGNATGREVFEFSEKIRHSVKEKFGIRLEREVVVV